MDHQLANDDPRSAMLTGKERVILILISKGSSDKEIGRLLALERYQVSQSAESICSKLGVRSRLAATLWAIKNRLDRRTDNAALTLYPVHSRHPPPEYLTAV